jgi:phage-related protein
VSNLLGEQCVGFEEVDTGLFDVGPIWLGRFVESKMRIFDNLGPAKRRRGGNLKERNCNLEPDDYRPMPSVGPGVIEIRIHSDTEYRVFYVAKYADTVFVLHAFEKKTRKTSQRDIDLGKQRLKEVRRWLRDQKQ